MITEKAKQIEHMDRDAHAFGLPTYSELLESLKSKADADSKSEDGYATRFTKARLEFDSHPARIAYNKKIMQSLNEGIPAGRAYYDYVAAAASSERAARIAINAKYDVFLA